MSDGSSVSGMAGGLAPGHAPSRRVLLSRPARPEPGSTPKRSDRGPTLGRGLARDEPPPATAVCGTSGGLAPHLTPDTLR